MRFNPWAVAQQVYSKEVTQPQPTVTPLHTPSQYCNGASRFMSTSGGLSRRRVGANGGGATSSYDDDDGNKLSNGGIGGGGGGVGVGAGSRSTTPVVSPLPHHAHAGSAFEGGNKIAFDPRDLQQDASEEARTGGKMPRLTIMEEVLLLGIKDKQVNLLFFYILFPFFFDALVLRSKIVNNSFFSNFVGLSIFLE